MLPGMRVPSAEQKQSGMVHWLVSHSGARFGSKSTAVHKQIKHTISQNVSNNYLKSNKSTYCKRSRRIRPYSLVCHCRTIPFRYIHHCRKTIYPRGKLVRRFSGLATLCVALNMVRHSEKLKEKKNRKRVIYNVDNRNEIELNTD